MLAKKPAATGGAVPGPPAFCALGQPHDRRARGCLPRGGIAPATWSVAILLVGVVLASLVMFALHNAILPLPVAWAYFGIYQFLVSPVGFKGAYPTLQIVALVGSGLLIGAAAIQLYRNHWHPIPAGSAVKAV